MLDSKAVASYFIEQSSRLDENDLTNLKLQKIMFYAQAESLNADGPLFNEKIEAWQYGPVVPSVYEWLKGCGAYPITTFDIPIDASAVKGQLKVFLWKVWQEYGKYSAGYLVEKTHATGSPWKKMFVSGRKNIIPEQLVKTAQLQNGW